MADDPATRLVELRIMYHYVQVAFAELPDCNGAPAGDLWHHRVPMLAFESEVILDAVLAISALHLQSLAAPDTTHEFSRTSAKYLNRALVAHRRILATNDKSMAETLLVSAILISNIAWLQAHRRVPDEAYDLPIHAYNMIQGVTALFLWKKPWFEEAGYGWFGQEEPIAVEEHVQPSHHFLLEVKRDLNRLERVVDAGKCKHHAVYREAIEYILWLYTAFVSHCSASHLHRFVGTMPLRLNARFLVLLKAHDPLCMALLARGLALLRLLEYAWWIHGRGEYEVLGFDMQGICGLMPADYRWMMDWPLKVASGLVYL